MVAGLSWKNGLLMRNRPLPSGSPFPPTGKSKKSTSQQSPSWVQMLTGVLPGLVDKSQKVVLLSKKSSLVPLGSTVFLSCYSLAVALLCLLLISTREAGRWSPSYSQAQLTVQEGTGPQGATDMSQSDVPRAGQGPKQGEDVDSLGSSAEDPLRLVTDSEGDSEGNEPTDSNEAGGTDKVHETVKSGSTGQAEVEIDGSLWNSPAGGANFKPCISPSKEYGESMKNQTRGFLTARANGGLNQMRAGICDMVAIARILNATLVIPELDKASFWKDSSTFSDVFDIEHFISSLKADVQVVRRLPDELKSAPVQRLHLKSWSPFQYYSQEIGSFWKEYKVLRALKTDSRLANNGLPPDIQKLRCRVQFQALKFSPQIEALGRKLIQRMRMSGPFLALHLRFEADMLAFTGCTQSLTKEEVEEVTKMRLSAPQWREKDLDPALQRAKGLCPLTPHEVGLFLSALGYPNSTRVYIASGEIYGGEGRMGELRKFFPNLERKETLATPSELRPLLGRQHALAALDFLVSVGSDVFVASYPGNMARAVEGHRRLKGHRRTIKPDSEGLVKLLDKLKHGDIQLGKEFNAQVAQMHSDRIGAPRKRIVTPEGTRRKDMAHAEESFYLNPFPECFCRVPQ